MLHIYLLVQLVFQINVSFYIFLTRFTLSHLAVLWLAWRFRSWLKAQDENSSNLKPMHLDRHLVAGCSKTINHQSFILDSEMTFSSFTTLHFLSVVFYLLNPSVVNVNALIWIGTCSDIDLSVLCGMWTADPDEWVFHFLVLILMRFLRMEPDFPGWKETRGKSQTRPPRLLRAENVSRSSRGSGKTDVWTNVCLPPVWLSHR